MHFFRKNLGFFQNRVILCFILISGCAKIPTLEINTINNDGLTPSIYDSYNERLIYENYDCQKLYNEIIILNGSENKLIIAKEKNLLSGRWYRLKDGLIQGDEIIISELKNVQRKKETAYSVYKSKGCIKG
tara:strand:+ start:308 stop:700 length:393 start_codon:yes stop_codon:yes gene_type:complete